MSMPVLCEAVKLLQGVPKHGGTLSAKTLNIVKQPTPEEFEETYKRFSKDVMGQSLKKAWIREIVRTELGCGQY